MTAYLTVTAILEWYDGPLMILGEDNAGVQYIGTLIDYSNEGDRYLCAPITQEQLDAASRKELDALDVYRQETLAYLTTLDYTKDGRGELSFIPRADVPPDYFIGKGYFFTPTDFFEESCP